MHIIDQSSTSCSNFKTKFDLDGATFTSLKAKGTRLLKHVKRETRKGHHLTLSSPSAIYKNASLVYWRNDTIGTGIDRLVDVCIRPRNDRL